MGRIHVLTLDKYYENPCVIFDKFNFEDLLDLETNLMLYNPNLIVEDYYHLTQIIKPMKPVEVTFEKGMEKGMEKGDEGMLKFVKIHKSELKNYLWSPANVRILINYSLRFKKQGACSNRLSMAGFIIHKDLLDNDFIEKDLEEAEKIYNLYYKK